MSDTKYVHPLSKGTTSNGYATK